MSEAFFEAMNRANVAFNNKYRQDAGKEPMDEITQPSKVEIKRKSSIVVLFEGGSFSGDILCKDSDDAHTQASRFMQLDSVNKVIVTTRTEYEK